MLGAMIVISFIYNFVYIHIILCLLPISWNEFMHDYLIIKFHT